jgi:hypothetical protein
VKVFSQLYLHYSGLKNQDPIKTNTFLGAINRWKKMRSILSVKYRQHLNRSCNSDALSLRGKWLTEEQQKIMHDEAFATIFQLLNEFEQLNRCTDPPTSSDVLAGEAECDEPGPIEAGWNPSQEQRNGDDECAPASEESEEIDPLLWSDEPGLGLEILEDGTESQQVCFSSLSTKNTHKILILFCFV